MADQNHWSNHVSPDRPETWPLSSDQFHRRGHHIQGAHGRRTALAADSVDSHLSGGMIALMPTAADAKRLAFPGGEKAAELHCTLLYLGDDGSVWSPEARDAMEAAARQMAAGVPPVKARIFGVAHWNGDGDKPSWVWSVGNDPDQELADSTLEEAKMIVGDVIGMSMAALDGDLPEIPVQHSPWVAHICAAYSGDLTVVRALEKKLGPVTFDRIRLSFGDDDRDIPLAGTAVSLTASAALRRDPLPHEAFTDFAGHDRQWEDSVATATRRLDAELANWRSQIKAQVRAGADDPEKLSELKVETRDAADSLNASMLLLARQAGDALAHEAERQGVEIPAWSLPEDTVTAAVGGQRLLRSVAQMSADLLATNMVQSARRFVTGLLTRDATPEALANAVDERLQEGQEQALKGPVGTAMATAQTAGRQAVLQAAPPGEYYASEILDRSTCDPCKAVDGEQFGDLERAIKAYPVMGYKDCVGPRYGHACRGFIVAQWTPEPEETEPVTAAGDVLPFHGTLGDPGYSKLHPGGKGKRQEDGAWLGSDRYSEEEQIDAFISYTGGGFADMNGYLRSGEHSGASEDIEQETHALNDLIRIQDPIKETQQLYRGMRQLPPELAQLKKGDTFHDRGFVSTTDNVEISREHFSGPKGGDGVLFSIFAPPGTRLLDGMKMGGYEEDSEFILPPGTRFRVRSVTVSPEDAKKYNLRTLITLEVVND